VTHQEPKKRLETVNTVDPVHSNTTKSQTICTKSMSFQLTQQVNFIESIDSLLAVNYRLVGNYFGHPNEQPNSLAVVWVVAHFTGRGQEM
jgi:hypothetical protein